MNNEEKQKEALITAIRQATEGGKISCAKATRLADDHDFSRQEMGKLLNELKIKIKNCQLGCF